VSLTKLHQAILAAGGIAASLPAVAGSISAEVHSADANPTPVVGAPLQNGDFYIANNPGAPLIGDGVDEWTYWSFDFTNDPGYANFITGGTLTSAVLTMDLNTAYFIGGVAPITDRIAIGTQTDGLPGQWNVPSFMTRTPGDFYQTGTIAVDLVSQAGFNGSDLFGWLKDNNGQFAVNYGDDALVVSASLTLSQDSPNVASVPEPETYAMMLMGLGIMGAVVRRRKKFGPAQSV
jgi:PEP-CTERM motif